MTSPLEQTLITMGFSAKEATVYIALLELGKGSVSQIARKANINRTTGYDILDTLVSKKLASISGKEPKQEYVAETPDTLQKLVENNLSQQEKNLETAQALIPQLKSIHNQAGRPQVRFYEGHDGLIQAYEDTLTSHEAIRAYASVEDNQNTLPQYFPKYYKRRAEKKISIRGIFPKTEGAVELTKRNKAELRDSVMVPSDKFSFSPEINIYDNKVMIASWREKLGIIIESAEIADAMKKIYELAWAEAKRLDQESLEQKG